MRQIYTTKDKEFADRQPMDLWNKIFESFLLSEQSVQAAIKKQRNIERIQKRVYSIEN